MAHQSIFPPRKGSINVLDILRSVQRRRTNNHNKAVESTVDWHKFREEAESLLKSLGAKYYIKEDLKKA